MENNLINLFNSLPEPKLGKEEFSALPIFKDSSHKIGKDIKGFPVLLISIKENDSYDDQSNILLKNIKIYFNIECSISENNKKYNQKFTLITFTGEDPSLYESFLRVTDLLLSSFGNSPSKKEIIDIVKKYIKLFKDINMAPSKSIQGLWSELFIIFLSKKTKEFIESWHVNPYDKVDFNCGETRLEVKSNSFRKRSHNFSIEQIEVNEEFKIYIASLFVERSGSGLSIEDLVLKIKKKVKNDLRIMEKVFEICYKTLGNSLDDSFKIKFDDKLAKSSLKIYETSEIPNLKVEEIPSEITDIKMKIDLKSSKEVEKDGEILKYFN